MRSGGLESACRRRWSNAYDYERRRSLGTRRARTLAAVHVVTVSFTTTCSATYVGHMCTRVPTRCNDADSAHHVAVAAHTSLLLSTTRSHQNASQLRSTSTIAWRNRCRVRTAPERSSTARAECESGVHRVLHDRLSQRHSRVARARRCDGWKHGTRALRLDRVGARVIPVCSASVRVRPSVIDVQQTERTMSMESAPMARFIEHQHGDRFSHSSNSSSVPAATMCAEGSGRVRGVGRLANGVAQLRWRVTGELCVGRTVGHSAAHDAAQR